MDPASAATDVGQDADLRVIAGFPPTGESRRPSSAHSTRGSVYDRYIQKQDGSVDRVLSGEYKDVLRKMSHFANGN